MHFGSLLAPFGSLSDPFGSLLALFGSFLVPKSLKDLFVWNTFSQAPEDNRYRITATFSVPFCCCHAIRLVFER
jgi:hypothetical protein